MSSPRTAPAAPRSLSLKLIGYILLISGAITLLLTGLQLWRDFDRDVGGVEERLDIIETTSLDPLASSVWALNEDQINLLLAGMHNLEAVTAVELVTDQGRTYRQGEPGTGARRIVRHYPLTWNNPRQPGQAYPLGTLTVYASLDSAYARLYDRAASILLGQGIKTLLVSVFILAIVQRLVTRHLSAIANYTRTLSLATLNRPLRLERPGGPGHTPDEFDQVEAAINYMRETLAEDIARREAAEHRLQQSEERYRQLFDTSMDGLAIFDLDGRLLIANRAYLDMIGYSIDEARRLTYQQLTPARWADEEARIVREQILGRGYSDVYEKECIRHDGRVLPVSVRGWLVRDESGQPQFLMSTARDISTEKALAEERRRFEEHLRERQRLETVGKLAGGIAHDFNNLLTPIKGYAEILLRELPAESPARARVDAIFHAAERGRRVVEKILLFSRRSATHRVSTDIGQVVRDSLELAGLSRPAGVRVETQVTSTNPWLDADPTQMHQVVTNLAINALHAMPAGGVLKVVVADGVWPSDAAPDDTITPGAPCLRIEVCDTGSGIAPDILPHVFEPFFTSKETGKGSGLGLSVVHGIVAAHGGQIDVVSRPGDTRFTVWLPRQPAGGAGMPPAAAGQ